MFAARMFGLAVRTVEVWSHVRAWRPASLEERGVRNVAGVTFRWHLAQSHEAWKGHEATGGCPGGQVDRRMLLALGMSRRLAGCRGAAKREAAAGWRGWKLAWLGRKRCGSATAWEANAAPRDPLEEALSQEAGRWAAAGNSVLPQVRQWLGRNEARRTGLAEASLPAGQKSGSLPPGRGLVRADQARTEGVRVQEGVEVLVAAGACGDAR